LQENFGFPLWMEPLLITFSPQQRGQKGIFVLSGKRLFLQNYNKFRRKFPTSEKIHHYILRTTQTGNYLGHSRLNLRHESPVGDHAGSLFQRLILVFFTESIT
jgi:hypothetical protein